MFKKMKENKKKGFTLVELIVVLVILAILAALLIPALTGYIDKARRKSVVAETRQVVMAAQSLIDEQYAKSETFASNTIITVDDKATTSSIDSEGNITLAKKDIVELSETTGDIGSITISTKGKVETLQYTKGTKVCTYQPTESGNTDGDYNVTDK